MSQKNNKTDNFSPRFCEDLWNKLEVRNFSEQELLLYRSNLLGSDKKITNFGGGNTSAKIMQADPLSGERVEVLWVKGSGGDLGSMKLDGFATLYLQKLQQLKTIYKTSKNEDEMVSFLSYCTFDLNTRAASIDTPLHAYLPFRHVDHVHPDAIIAIAAAKDGEQLTHEIFKREIGWLNWRRPGFVLGLELEKFARENPDKKGVILESHGLFTWHDDAYGCYKLTIDTINKAQRWIDHELEKNKIFGGRKYEAIEQSTREIIATRLMPVIRGLIGADEYMVGHFRDDDSVLEFVNSNNFVTLANMGTSCPDHFLRTKIRPFIFDIDPENIDIDSLIDDLPQGLKKYRQEYESYYERCKHENSPTVRNKNPVIFLMPGVGLFSFANNKPTARIASEFYINAIAVMRVADAVSEYVALPEQEAFDIEYWLLEEAKLQRMPRAKSLAGQVALITGAAGGIGKAVAYKLLQQGACVLLTDIDESGLTSLTQELVARFDGDRVRSFTADITAEKDVIAMVDYCCLEYGGLDLLVSNAGIASSSPIEKTSMAMWQKNMDILSTGYFLISRECFKVFQWQTLPGAVVFVASKNGLVASKNAAAYCTAKASEIQLARSLALEGAAIGIRVNVVNPDAVLQDSKIWSGQWRKERADAYQMAPEDLQAYYCDRSLLKRNVYPEDIANAAFFLLSDKSAKSTGNIINVDAGHAPSFTR